ncbi:MAG: PaaI family thioesterase [Bacteroidota bacterium]
MEQKAIQDYYPDDLSHCYGCGYNNDHGLQIKSFWDGEETVAIYTPKPFHTAIPGFVYGGLTASLIDCHGTGTAAAAAYRKAGRAMGTDPAFRFVTASLQVDFKKPTPLGVPLIIRGKVAEITDRKVIVDVTVSAGEAICSTGRVVAVLLPESMSK